MLEVRDLNAYYGKSHILQGVTVEVAAGEVVSLLGRNGVGRSTTLKAIMGEVAPVGTVRFLGRDIAGLPSYKIARLGLGYVPENRDIFPTRLTGDIKGKGQRPGQGDTRECDIDPSSRRRQAVAEWQRGAHRPDGDRAMAAERTPRPGDRRHPRYRHPQCARRRHRYRHRPGRSGTLRPAPASGYARDRSHYQGYH